MKMAKSNQPASPVAQSASGGSFLPVSTPAPPLNPLILPAPLPACLKRREVAELLQASVSTVDRMVANGEIRATYVGRLVRFRREDVEVWLTKKTEGGKSPAAPGRPSGPSLPQNQI